MPGFWDLPREESAELGLERENCTEQLSPAKHPAARQYPRGHRPNTYRKLGTVCHTHTRYVVNCVDYSNITTFAFSTRRSGVAKAPI